MANHVIYDKLWSSRKLARCSKAAALAYPWLFLVADDWGRFEYLPRMIWGRVFGSREDITPKDVQKWLAEYEEAGLLVRYGQPGQETCFWAGFKGRPVSKRRASELPEPPVAGTDTKGDPPKEPSGQAPEQQASTADNVPVPFPKSSLQQQLQHSTAQQETEQQQSARSGGSAPPPPQAPGGGKQTAPRLTTLTTEQRAEYSREVTREWLEHRGPPPPGNGHGADDGLNTSEWAAVSRWQDLGIPLRIVLEGIRNTGGKPRTLHACEPAILEEHRRVSYARVG